MSTINDAVTGKVRRSKNLRGLVDPARRVRNRVAGTEGERMWLELTPIGIPGSPVRAHVWIKYSDGSVGQATFNSYYSARLWSLGFCLRNQGFYHFVGDGRAQ